jgi:F420-0:gamma-glutamyl ligase
VKTELIVDKGASLHLDGLRREDVKLEEGRSDLFEVLRLGEEAEDVCSRSRNEERAVKVINHRASAWLDAEADE